MSALHGIRQLTPQTSKAGVAIGKLRNSTSPGVSTLAKEVVKKWKEAIEQQKSKRKRDDGDEVKKEDGGKKVKTEGMSFPSKQCLLANSGRIIGSTITSTSDTVRIQSGSQTKEGRNTRSFFFSSSIAKGGRWYPVHDRRVAQNTSNGRIGWDCQTPPSGWWG